MTVKVLTDTQKAAVVTIYQARTKSITEMARHLNTSTRTIVRVLNEAGYLTEDQQTLEGGKQAIATLQKWGIKPGELNLLLQCLEDAKLLKLVDGKIQDISIPAPTKPEIVKHLVDMDEELWSHLLNEVITARVAVNYNKHVQTNMLNLQNKVEANERDNEQRK